jgi:hypothetical protein
MYYTVGLKLDGRARHVATEGDDALDAAQKVKLEHPTASITYVRRMNRRGDARDPIPNLAQSAD